MGELLVLDFDGVCTYTAGELIRFDADPASIEQAVRPGAIECIEAAARSSVCVAVLSNELSSEWLDRLEILRRVDHVVLCSDNGIYKPDRRAFQRCVLLAGASAEGTLVVDDSADNVRVADSLGMASILFDPTAPDPWQPVMDWLQP